MGITNVGAFPRQVDRTIIDMFYDQFTTYTPMWPLLMSKAKAPKGADFTRADLAGLGSQLRETGEGEAVDYDVPSEGNKVQRFYKKYTLGFQITEEMLEDELFDKMNKMSASLAKCANYTIEAKVWALINGAFGTTLGKDGQYLISNAHKTLRSPTVTANTNLITGDLDTTTLQQAIEFFQTIILTLGAIMIAYLGYRAFGSTTMANPPPADSPWRTTMPSAARLTMTLTNSRSSLMYCSKRPFLIL